MTLYYKVIFLYFRMDLPVEDIIVILSTDIKELNRQRTAKGRERPYIIVEKIILNEMRTLEYLRNSAFTPLNIKQEYFDKTA